MYMYMYVLYMLGSGGARSRKFFFFHSLGVPEVCTNRTLMYACRKDFPSYGIVVHCIQLVARQGFGTSLGKVPLS